MNNSSLGSQISNLRSQKEIKTNSMADGGDRSPETKAVTGYRTPNKKTLTN